MERIYGRVNTHLVLTDKARQYYAGCDPLTIIEHETIDASGEPVYTYSIREPEHGMTHPVTADALITWLEAGFDEDSEVM